MNEKVLPDGKSSAPVISDYEKPRLEPLGDYLDTTLQQTVIIPTSIWGEQ